MGQTGPVPKRSEQLIRRNAQEVPVDKITVIGPVEIPELGIPNAHPLIQDLYRSLTESAQKQYYEPSDWAYARLALHFANKLVKSSKPSAQMLVSVNQMLTSLLMTEGDRRRVRLEIERNQSDEGGQVLQVADLFRQHLQAASGITPEGSQTQA